MNVGSDFSDTRFGLVDTGQRGWRETTGRDLWVSFSGLIYVLVSSSLSAASICKIII